MNLRLGLFALGAAILAAGCRSKPSQATPDPPPAASASAPAAPIPARGEQLTLAEQRHDSKRVTLADLSTRNVLLRRRAAQVLARIADARAAKLLSTSLADEDDAVVESSAFGLGRTCAGRETQTVNALVARAASLAAEPPARATASPRASDPMRAITGALAACGTLEAERTLRAWLSGAFAEEAALALGKFGATHGRLEESSIVALLDAASAERPIPDALYAFTRLGGLGEPVRARLLEVAKEALAARGSMRSFAVRALEHAGDGAVPVLVTILTSPEYTPSQRADAARALGRMGEPGQAALAAALARLLPAHDTSDPESTAALVIEPDWAPVIAALQALENPARRLRKALARWSELALPPETEPTARRRIVALRCRAASLLAGSASLSKRLVACDPDRDGRTGALAIVEALGRGPLKGGRYRRWLTFASAQDPVVRQAALDLMQSHPEIAEPAEILRAALDAKRPGTVARAAEILAAHPDRASADEKSTRSRAAEADSVTTVAALRPDPKLVQAVLHDLDSVSRDAVETRGALLQAAGALGLLNVKPRAEAECKSANATLRAAAAHTLGLLGDRNRRCNDFAPNSRVPEETSSPLLRPVRLTFHTDAGALTLTLDPSLAPVAVARIVRLAKAGFYDGMPVHRYVPGFVVQFGDPDGDGYADGREIPIASEVAPLPFDAWTVGLALGGPDTGSTQLFVTLGRWPHLDGKYPLLGRADPSWGRLALGDVIRKVEVGP